MTFQTLTNVPVTELHELDWPVSIAGYRPIERITNKPRKREVVLTIDGQRHTFPHHHRVGRVRRPVMAATPTPHRSADALPAA